MNKTGKACMCSVHSSFAPAHLALLFDQLVGLLGAELGAKLFLMPTFRCIILQKITNRCLKLAGFLKHWI